MAAKRTTKSAKQQTTPQSVVRQPAETVRKEHHQHLLGLLGKYLTRKTELDAEIAETVAKYNDSWSRAFSWIFEEVVKTELNAELAQEMITRSEKMIAEQGMEPVYALLEAYAEVKAWAYQHYIEHTEFRFNSTSLAHNAVGIWQSVAVVNFFGRFNSYTWTMEYLDSQLRKYAIGYGDDEQTES